MKSTATKIWINHDHLTDKYEVYDGIMRLHICDTHSDAEKYIAYLNRLEELHAKKENEERTSPQIVPSSQQTDGTVGDIAPDPKNETNQ